MLKQIIYIGPLKISLTAEDSMGALLCDRAFERPVCSIKEHYFAQAVTVPEIVPVGRVIYSGNGMEVRNVQESNVQESNVQKGSVWESGVWKSDVSGRCIQDAVCEHRYCYQVVSGENQYFAHFSLHENQIRIELQEKVVLAENGSRELWRFLFLERLLLEQDAMILHSASVVWNKAGILFSAPSGTGKSTQADLWKSTVPDCIGLNGDRNLLYRQGDRWMVSGLPWHGTSLDCENMQCPVRAIVYIRRSKSDYVQRLSPFERNMLLYGEVTVNRWKIECAGRVLDLLGDLSNKVPVVALNCTPTPSAVACLKSFLEGLGYGDL